MSWLVMTKVPVSRVLTLGEQNSSTARKNTEYRRCLSALIVASTSPTGSGNRTRSMACAIAVIIFCWFSPSPIPLGDSTMSLRCCTGSLALSSNDGLSSNAVDDAEITSSKTRAPLTVSTLNTKNFGDK